MTSKASIHLAIAAAGAIASVPTLAAPVSVSESFTLSTLLNGNSTSLDFDIGSFLNQQGLSASRVLSGEVVVHGFSEANYGQTQAGAYSAYQTTGGTQHEATAAQYSPAYTVTYAYDCSSSWSHRTCYGSYYVPGYTYYFGYTVYDTFDTRYRDLLHVDSVADQLKVSAGATSATDTVDTHSASTGSYGSSRDEGQVCSARDSYGNCSLSYRYNRERDVYEALFGALDATLALDSTALLDLRTDGILGVGFAALAGQFGLQSIQFNLQVEANSSSVPEPAAPLLAGTALAGALYAARRRRKP